MVQALPILSRSLVLEFTQANGGLPLVRLLWDIVFSFWGFAFCLYASIVGVIVWLLWPWSIILMVLALAFVGFMVHVFRGLYQAKQVHMKNKAWDGSKLYNPNPDI